MLLKYSTMESAIFLSKNILLTDLLGNQHLFEILQTSFIFKNSENMVKSRCLEKFLQWTAPILFRNEGRV